MAAVAGTLLPQVAYAAPSSPTSDDDKGVVDTIAGWFSDDDEDASAAPPAGGRLEIPSRQKLPRAVAEPAAKRVRELTDKRTSGYRRNSSRSDHDLEHSHRAETLIRFTGSTKR
ncbi:hypothetical protein ACFT5C_25560 [Streptomyces sp. NPDC057116]|uniref:hypothetical protein n=1 Tax=Streptomyces sp. NPDC057116 TaxID=3346023 RepID=UPI00364379BB